MQANTRAADGQAQPLATKADEEPAVAVFVSLDSIERVDGTGLDALRETIDDLRRARVTIAGWSQRTRAEVERFREEWRLTGPFVAEGGAALFMPAGWLRFTPPSTRSISGYDVLEFGVDAREVRATVRRVAASMKADVRLLGEMTIAEAAETFAVSLPEARLMKLREYSELVALQNGHQTTRARLLRAVRAAGLYSEPSLRYAPYEYASSVADRTLALQAVHGLLRGRNHRLATIGIGSTTDDLPVLRAADVSLIVQPAHASEHSHLAPQVPLARMVTRPGLLGWSEALRSALTRIGAVRETA